MRRSYAVAGASLVLAGGAGLALTGGGSPSERKARPAVHAQRRLAPPARVPEPEVRSRPPVWLAPGGRLTVRGFAARDAAVSLRAGGALLARTRTGPLGGFVLHARAPAPGSYRLVVVCGGARSAPQRLVVRPLVLDAVGDVTPGEDVGPAVAAHGGAYPWRSAGRTLAHADIATANLEGAVSERGTAAADKEYHFRGPASLLRGARTSAGIDVLTLANNHSLDYGAQALTDTRASARAAGILTVGAGPTAAAARRPAYVRSGGLTVAFLGYSDVNPLGFLASASSPGTAAADPAAIDVDVRAARRRADLVVVWFHWGVELRREPDARQQRLAAAALNAGAVLVLGAHPHVFGPISRPDDRRLVAWTLGNFVFPSQSAGTRATGILEVRLDARGVRGYRVLPALAGVQPTLS